MGSRYRYQTDPLYHAAVELVARTVLHAVEEADKYGHPARTPFENRFALAVQALVDGPPDSQEVVDVAVALTPVEAAALADPAVMAAAADAKSGDRSRLRTRP